MELSVAEPIVFNLRQSWVTVSAERGPIATIRFAGEGRSNAT